MTTRAREVLVDCEHALTDFATSPNTPFQRSRWVSLITLLRTVGFVLQAADRPVATSEVQRRIDVAWAQLKATKPEPRIFHEFVAAERNDAVHQFDIGAAVNVTIRLGGVGTDTSPAGPPTYDFVMRDGPYAGRDPLELAREAIQFWRDYLDGIESGAPV